jgi:hypothetical protein
MRASNDVPTDVQNAAYLKVQPQLFDKELLQLLLVLLTAIPQLQATAAAAPSSDSA